MKFIKSLKEISSLYNLFIFDIDGVIVCQYYQIYKQNYIPHSLFSYNKLLQQKKHICFLTNKSLFAYQVEMNLKKLGYQINASNIFTAKQLSIKYLQQYLKNGTVYLIGQISFKQKMQQKNLSLKWANDHDSQEIQNILDFNLAKISFQNISHVLVTKDYFFSYYKLCFASLCVQNKAKLLTSHIDIIRNGNYLKPGVRTIFKSIQIASSTKGQVIGKPSTYSFYKIKEKYKVKKQQTLMIGDSLQTDIEFAQNCGIDSLCLLSGNTTKQTLKISNIVPTYWTYRL